MKKQTTSLYDTAVLTAITLAAGLLLGLVHAVTAGPIAAETERTRIRTMQAVFADAEVFEEVTDLDRDNLEAMLDGFALTKTSVRAVYTASDAEGQQLGYVVDSVNREGYGGEIEIMTGVRADGEEFTVNAISFLTLTETAGMGMKAREPAFLEQFEGLGGDDLIRYTKTGRSGNSEVDVISGCTVTTNSVVKAVNAALAAVYTCTY